ncbi:MAG: triose-phosphate isomerase [Rhodobiaceae bacterium]|nr:triose-phosphate isomerase [Rhodobiaceae bacterium]MCC0016405.1 triose-phosphate isomerase [Rhodobiaceae bacterium]MCC0041284.1 triose-phosphate isomerase [Rhodobiaceae bacterium]MCC0052741.1 triose-phosphate isomerase [Rhodobiaceae bacterium]
MIKPLVAGNWKMNGLRAGLPVISEIAQAAAALSPHVDLMICPPATLVASAAQAAKGTLLAIGGQDCHAKASGAHTGDISAQMLADAGSSAVIVGHSERRADHGEDDATVLAKAEAALGAGLVAIVCVGETEAERKAGKAVSRVMSQLAGSLPGNGTAATVIVAYEPVWAIGTGLTPTVDDVAEMHAAIREYLEERFASKGSDMRILYGGSVKPSNAAELMGVANVDGALVGGASLKAADFLGIANAYA